MSESGQNPDKTGPLHPESSTMSSATTSGISSGPLQSSPGSVSVQDQPKNTGYFITLLTHLLCSQVIPQMSSLYINKFIIN